MEILKIKGNKDPRRLLRQGENFHREAESEGLGEDRGGDHPLGGYARRLDEARIDDVAREPPQDLEEDEGSGAVNLQERLLRKSLRRSFSRGCTTKISTKL